ncbi:thioredoxin peroxidase [Histomonas meleagridis]|uniref:thioredoxin peroxidase n=1 Tax=Histomonas meleagridis TaxID=135588 RepID=UPI00355A8B79|nr:thioredoxin peroxidase [Histomonas meleagridis]KAH0802372.1 thioredoxin peroxidase [Histomonas meleagridis]
MSCHQESAVVGSFAPCFSGVAVNPKHEFVEVSLGQFKGKWLVLFTYPLDFTFVCPTEVIAFSEAAKKFNEINCEVVGMSTDSIYSHLEWIGKPRNTGGLGEMNIMLIGDLGAKISKKYGFYSEEAGHDIRGTAIIDPKGIIRHLSMDNPEVGRNVDEVLRLVKGYQYVAKHGEVCPAQWEEGKDTIKPNPKDSKEFFSKVH